MDDNVINDMVSRTHERIDKIVECNAETAALQKTLTEDVKELTKTMKEQAQYVHQNPCRDCRDNAKAIKALSQRFDAEQKATIAIEREVKRDWRRWFLGLLKIGVIAIGAFIAGRASELWHFIKGH